jgi:Tfp pilus assembly protein PilF
MIQEEMKTRRDIYEQDALAWVLYQTHRYAEARQASEKALELNTPEPAFYYHAGMIASALGDASAARKHLERALALNANFDPKQAAVARAALKEVSR